MKTLWVVALIGLQAVLGLPAGAQTRTPFRADPGAAIGDQITDIRDRLQQADALLQQRQYADSRRIYEALLAKYPRTAWQIEQRIAGTYLAENRQDEAMAHMQAARAAQPADADRIGAGELIERMDDIGVILDSFDVAAVKDPTPFVSAGAARLQQGRVGDARQYFEYAIRYFPDAPEAYFYRGLVLLSRGREDQARVDLLKFLSMPTAKPAEVEDAKKILAQIK